MDANVGVHLRVDVHFPSAGVAHEYVMRIFNEVLKFYQSLTAELVVGQAEPRELVETAELRRDCTCKQVIYVCGGNR